jgi:outer membrane protein assembly factor BamB
MKNMPQRRGTDPVLRLSFSGFDGLLALFMFKYLFRPLWFCLAMASIGGLSAWAADTNTITEVWHFALGSGQTKSSPAVAADGTVYQGTFDGWLFALSPEGKKKWSYRVGSEIFSSPAVGEDGTIYFGSRDRNLYALTPAGKLKWSFHTDAWVDSSPAIGKDGTVYFGSWDRQFYALSADGQLKWKFATSNVITTSPAIAADGTIYFGSHDQNLYALAPDGKLRWQFGTGAQIDISPTIARDGTIYFGSTDGFLYALRPDGTELWRLRTESYTASPPVLDAVGNLFLAAGREHISVSPDGKLRWTSHTDVPMDMAELVADNGLIYLSTPWLRIGYSTRDGRIENGFQMGFCLTAAPNVDRSGIIYACDGMNLFALKPAAGAVLEKSPWPMWRANPQHTERVQ